LTDKAGFSISGIKTTLDALNDISAAQVNAEVDTALADYDSPTKAELDTAQSAIQSDIAALPTASESADAVWDETQPGHTTVGTFGKYLDTEVSGVGGGTPPTVGEIADAVWDEATSGHKVAGTFGKLIQFIKTYLLGM
jgi:hypothetical protein